MTTLTKKEADEKRRLDRKIFGGKATRKEVLRALDLKRKLDRLTAAGRPL
jgi:hypothetical protein